MKRLSMYLCYFLRHRPEAAGLKMDEQGWVDVDALIDGVNKKGKFTLDRMKLDEIVKGDSKGRYKYSEDRSRIKACQGHSIPWVKPELQVMAPPRYLYHGTTTDAFEKIMKSGKISRMSRHAVHMQEDKEKAWQSAVRWRKTPVVLKIDAQSMSLAGFVLGKTENDVWCTEEVPSEFIVDQLFGIEE